MSVNGIRASASFDTKSEAQAWAALKRTELLDNKNSIKDVTVGDLLSDYAKKVSSRKKGERWELIRLKAIRQMPVAKARLPKLSASDIAAWRDERLKAVSGATVNREWTLLSNVFTVAINEWRFLTDHPMKGVKRPKESPPRDRRITKGETEKIVLASGYDRQTEPKEIMQIVCVAFLFAIETAMRAGEILKLARDDVDFEKRVAVLRETKNGTARRVPLSTEAVRLLKQLPENDTGFLFGITSASLDANFRKIKKRAMIEDLHFHDTRHEAITRLAKKLDVLDLARMAGHKDLRQLMTYYNATAEELAAKLD